jgi:hypothetical protein
MNHSTILTLLSGAMALAGCASTPAPTTTAAKVERMQCAPGDEAQARDLVRSATVLRVEPLYSHVLTSNNNSEERVNGAKVVVRPPDGVTAEQMTRVLQCESARILLGKVRGAAADSDPYWLPDTWVSIEVIPEDGNFTVRASADSVTDNLQVFGRASRYAEHRMAAGSELP